MEKFVKDISYCPCQVQHGASQRLPRHLFAQAGRPRSLSQHSCFQCFLIYEVGRLSATCSALVKSLQIIDSSNCIWCGHFGKNKAASCVFMWASKSDRVPLSGGHGLRPGQNHFQVSGHRTVQDDLFKKESFKGLKEIKRVYFSSNYACAFP